MSETSNNGFFVALTNAGAALQTNAWQGGDKINLTDFNIGSDPSAISTAQTDVLAPVGERMKINMLKQKDDDAGVLEVVCVLPPEIGGWNMASIGLFTDTGILFAIANIPSDYKPVPTEGATKETTITMYISLGSTEKINLIIDPYKVIAMQDWVNTESVPAKHMGNNENPHTVTLQQVLEASKMQTHQVIIPAGTIVMWSGALNAVPTGWALCNGKNNTPNLCDRFIVGAGNKYTIGASGGAESKTTSAGGAHAHAVNINSNSAGGHSHTFSVNTSSNGNHAHTTSGHTNNHTLSAAEIPAHNHGNVPKRVNDVDRGETGKNSFFSLDNIGTTANTGGSQGHRHVVNIATTSSGHHDHTVTGSTANHNGHAHNISGNTANTGSHSHTINVLPPYYALAFIMKIEPQTAA